MRQVIRLDDGSRLEIDNAFVKHVGADNRVLYTSGEEPVPIVPAFFNMTERERQVVVKWLNKVEPLVEKEKDAQKKFLERVKKAIKVVDYSYCIAIFEPACDEYGNIFYKQGEKVACNRTYGEWEESASKFYADGKWHSRLAILEEGDLFKAYRIAMGYWSLECVCENSSSVGNYRNSPEPSFVCDPIGAKEAGGFYDGAGNTIQVYKTPFGFACVGGMYRDYGSEVPIGYASDLARFCKYENLYNRNAEDSTGVVAIVRNSY